MSSASDQQISRLWNPQQKPPHWENPTVFGINKRNAHVPLRSYTHVDQAFNFYRLQPETVAFPSPRRQVLNGNDWKFCLKDRPSEVPEGFWKLDYKEANVWEKVRMPLFWWLSFSMLVVLKSLLTPFPPKTK